ncbi:mandelate racemase/muconate lactonizing enzyme family protein [Telmatospirillum sp.]|uniref:mandelate racemase/muconate lactonizing enzyme family protein n=1 Tax=Telmatospirillum sp. TaxID=2079197 RepID=UPI00283CBB3C|nr:mandelate racemase/muconate lactonizing enzyme family protein [Telmatospirillum sp.]MDR3438313.1 mandelate racemase/muconate lactonizing enzyme family protein [Telmatospirillum sp.]
MKITSVDIFKVNDGKPSILEGSGFFPVVVRVNTDENISGFGELGLAYGNAQNAGFGMAVDFAKMIIGMNPLNNEEIWEKLFRKPFWGMGGGTVVFSGISAIDIALWDIRGKYFNTPVYNLLGGKTNTRLRSYASQLQFDWDEKTAALVDPKDYAKATRKALNEGYDCIKVDPVGFDLKGNWMGWNNHGILGYDQLQVAVNRVAAMREEGGEKMDIIIELHSLTDTNTAVQLGRELEKFRIFYYEEPVHPLNSVSMREVSKRVNIPIASGERIYTRWGYRPFFEDRSINVIQPDLGNCGGITEGKKVCDMANTYDAAVQVHVCGGPIATAAALQLEAVIPNFLIHEQHAVAQLKANRETCKYDYLPKNGFFEIPDLPGIGQELTEKAMNESRRETVK